MAVVRFNETNTRDPFSGLFGLHSDLDRLFNLASYREGLESGSWTPAIDFYEEGDHYVVKADLPGISKKDVNVSLEDNVLSVRGQRNEEREEKEATWYRTERVSGSFQRIFHLPGEVNAKKIKARFVDGVLEITIPKAEEAKPKQIDIDVT